MSFTYQYPRPAVTVDIILVTKDSAPELLLIQRKNDPCKDLWAFPGGFLDMDEDLIDAAKRELEEETGIRGIDLKQFQTYGTLNRDPRGRTVSVVFYALIESKLLATAMDDAKDAQWFKLNNLPTLAFDHKDIIREFIEFIE
ncbi:NUDIX hydrolase [Plebeiibacterium marinum]|uniref:NUDIX hydrolase n=1 Tax=Plebeiibacterium marinum TaxID=2992111 RepID=A0AAE3MAN3_9BACT|nr:NUDIX hydrolase [Plebeiobacterium marinum]MCW3804195.1 NUDIX hydrolase [Plebeiobacterium marinum]